MSEGFILHGTIVYSKDPEHLQECPDSYVICKDGYSEGVFSEIPEEYSDLPIEDYWDKLIIPGMMDLFAVAPAYQIRGMYLNPKPVRKRSDKFADVERSFSEEVTAERSYDMFVDSLYIGATTRAVVLGDPRVSSTLKLMDLMDESGLISCVGMSPLKTDQTKESQEVGEFDRLADWLNSCADRFDRTNPILFLPDIRKMTEEELSELVTIVKETELPTFLIPDSFSSGHEKKAGITPDTLTESIHDGLLGAYGSSAVYGCYNMEKTMFSLQENGSYLVSCPLTECFDSQLTGLPSAKSILQDGIHVGLGSGTLECGTDMMKIVRSAILASRIKDASANASVSGPLTFEEGFYIATAGGGKFFGECGSFEPGNQFDAVVLDDQICDTMVALSPRERLERMIYLSDDRNVVGKYVFGDKLY